MTRRKKIVLGGTLALVVTAAAGWHWQSEIIGVGARWYLARIAAREEAAGSVADRRQMVSRMNRLLLMAPPPDALVPELFDLITAISSRVASGEIDLAWAAYVYSGYQRDLVRDRPGGRPRRSMSDVASAVEGYVQFYSLQRRPDETGFRLSDLTAGEPGESYTVDEIREAARQGRDLARVPTPQR
jgi:hypothetical protein